MLLICLLDVYSILVPMFSFKNNFTPQPRRCKSCAARLRRRRASLLGDSLGVDA